MALASACVLTALTACADTVGYWNETQPVGITLAAGAHTLTFTRNTTKSIAFKEFVLYATKPQIPPPPANFPPAPPPPVGPPTPPASDFIEVPASTSCEGQGIKEVPQAECQAGLQILGAESSF